MGILSKAPNLAVQVTAASHCSLYALGGSLSLGFVLAQSPAAVPDLARSASCPIPLCPSAHPT